MGSPMSLGFCFSRRLLGGVAVLALLSGCAAVAPEARPGDAELIARLSAQAHAWDEAIVRKDRAGIEANMAEDFRQIDGQGNVETKQSFVADLLSPDLVIHPYKVEDFEVRLYGDVALISGRTRLTGSYQGKAFNSHYRYIDVYVRRAAAWKIVSVQISKLPG